MAALLGLGSGVLTPDGRRKAHDSFAMASGHCLKNCPELPPKICPAPGLMLARGAVNACRKLNGLTDGCASPE